LLEHKEI